MSQEQKALEILRVFAQTAAEGKCLTIANDWGFGTATVINQDDAHTHVGADYLESEQQNFEVFVDHLHALLIENRGLSWAAPSIRCAMTAALKADISSERAAHSILTEEAAALRDEVELKQACINGMRKQVDKMAAELDSTQQWYAVRFERLKDLARTLPEPVQHDIFSILANGTADATEPPSYGLQMNVLRHERDHLHDHAQRADDFEIMLRQLVHSTRDVADSRVVSTRQKADELLRRKGTSSALRLDDLGNPCESECPACVGCKAKEPSARMAAENHQLYKQDYAFPPSCFSPDGQTWRQLAEMQSICLAQSADADRVINWIRNSTKRAVTAFTEGPERQIAYAVEDDRLRRNRANQQTLKGKAE